MISHNIKSGLLQDMTTRNVVSVDEPNLLRHMFPYSEVPKILFDGKSVPMQPAPDFFITDTTFRDGQQARPPYTVSQIVEIFDMLSRLSGPNGVVRVSEFFLYSEKDREAVSKCQELGHKYPEITGWIRASKEDFKLVKSMGLKETGILTSASDYHIFMKFKKTREQMMDHYADLVTTALESGLKAVRCHLEDITRADFDGFIIPLVQRLMEIARDSKKAVKIRLCDTMGYGLPWAEATLPRSIPKICHAMVHECGVPHEWLEWHGHNDFHKVLANATTAWLYGCGASNCSILGFGERTGNPPLEGAIIDYISLRGDANGVDTTVIHEIAEYFQNEIGFEIPSGFPFVGQNFNVTSAGIHADGMLKNEEIYNIFDTGKILHRPARVNVTDKSGVAGIAHWINNYLELKPKAQIDKRHHGVQEIYEMIKEEYEDGRVTSISDEEMLTYCRMYLPEHFKSDFAKLKEHAMDLSENIIEWASEQPGIVDMDPEDCTKVLQKLIKKHHFIQFAYVVDKDGNKITENVCQPEYSEQFATAGLEWDFSDRDWFTGAMKTDGAYISDFYKSKWTGFLCVTVAASIMDSKDKKIGVVGADLTFEELSRISEGIAKKRKRSSK